VGLFVYFFAVLTGSQLGYVLSMITYKKTGSVVTSAAVFYAAVILCVVISRLAQRDTYKRIYALFIDESRKADFLKKCESELQFSCDSILKSKLSMLMCEYYMRENSDIKAHAYLKKVNRFKQFKTFNRYFRLNSEIKLKYYVKSVYLNVCFNNIIDAQGLKENGSWFFEHYKDSEYSCEINSVLGMLEYAKGLYNEADRYIEAALDSCENISKRENLKLIKAKIYLKTEQAEKAHRLLERIIADNVSENTTLASKELLTKLI
jgi:tetratricopeptide (TPR) repeat protein